MANLDNPPNLLYSISSFERLHQVARITAIMADVSPELQERLEELDRELEVSRMPPDCSTNPRLPLNALLAWRLNSPLQLF